MLQTDTTLQPGIDDDHKAIELIIVHQTTTGLWRAQLRAPGVALCLDSLKSRRHAIAWSVQMLARLEHDLAHTPHEY